MFYLKNTVKLFIILFILILFSCGNDSPENVIVYDENNNSIDTFRTINYDLDSIIKRDTLKAITVYSPTSYFIYKGKAMGFEHDLLKVLAKKMDLTLKIVVAKNIDEMISMLNSGRGDIIAYGLTITENRKQYVSFTKPYMKINQVLVQKKPDNWRKINKDKLKKHLVNDVTELAGKTISVRKETSYYERLLNLSNEIGNDIIIDPISGDITTDEIIGLVSNGKIKYTIADNNIAAVNSAYYSNIDINTDVSLSQNLAWAVRKTSTKLLERINKEVGKAVGSKNYNIIYNKYFKSNRNYVKRVKSDYYTKETGKVSPYDNLIKKYSSKIDWDWLLVSAVVFQESKFDNSGQSWVGARGLMQLMPATAKDLGVKNVHNPEQNIKGGTKYLKQIWNRWPEITDSIQRIKFTLASYNCGYYHVKDAQYLAKYYKKNSLSWDNGVDRFILKLSSPKYYNHKGVKYGYARGTEPYNYVYFIFENYNIYKDLMRD